MEQLTECVSNMDRHVEGIAYYIGRMRRHLTSSAVNSDRTFFFNLPLTCAGRQSGDLRQRLLEQRSSDVMRKTGSLERSEICLCRCRLTRPLSANAVALRSPIRCFMPSKKINVGIVGLSSQTRILQSATKHKFSRNSSFSTSLLDSSLCTLSGSTSSESLPVSPSRLRRGERPTMTSSVSSAFESSLRERRTLADQIATRWERWRSTAYRIFASHYERCHALLATAGRTEMRRLELTYGGNKRNFAATVPKEDMASVSDAIDFFKEPDDFYDVVEDPRQLATIFSRHKMNHEVLATAQMVEMTAALLETESVARRALEKEALCVIGSLSNKMKRGITNASICAAQRMQQLLREEEANEVVQGCMIERVEEREFSKLFQAMDRDVWVAAQLEVERSAEVTVSTRTSSVSSLDPVGDFILQRTENAIQAAGCVSKEDTTKGIEKVLVHGENNEELLERPNLSVNEISYAGSYSKQPYISSGSSQTAVMGSHATITNWANCSIGATKNDEKNTTSDMRNHIFLMKDKFAQTPPLDDVFLLDHEVRSSLNLPAKREVSPGSVHELSLPTTVEDNTASSSGNCMRQQPIWVNEDVQQSLQGDAHMGHGKHALFSSDKSSGLHRSIIDSNELTLDSCTSGFDQFEIVSSANLCLYSSFFCRLFYVEKRYRKYLKDQELAERNEIRWYELNSYRTLSWLYSCMTAEAENIEEDYAILHKEKLDSTSLHVTTDTPLSHSFASLRIYTSSRKNGKKENDMPRTDAPQQTSTDELRLPTAWCIDMTSGAPRAPPRLTGRHRTNRINRRVLISDGQQMSKQGQTLRVSARNSGAGAKRRRRNCAHKTGGDLPSGVAGYRTEKAFLQRIPETVPARRGTPFLGYTEQYQRRLLWQQEQARQKNASGILKPEPLHRKATASFLESAEWRYQKMYVENQLCMFYYGNRRETSARKCADIVCDEVTRAQNNWESARR